MRIRLRRSKAGRPSRLNGDEGNEEQESEDEFGGRVRPSFVYIIPPYS